MSERRTAQPPLWRGKGRTLERLAPLLRHSAVPHGVCIDAAQWRAARVDCLQRIQREFAGAALAVRSSRDGEDAPGESQAGRYLSRLDVAAADATAIAAAIDAVFASYGVARPWDDVLLQAMVAARVVAVAATHAIEDGAAYYVFSLGDEARTDAVTRGDAPVRTVYVARDAAPPDDPDVAPLYAAMRELERVCGGGAIEAELALDGDRVILLQVRPLNVALPDPVPSRRRRVALALEQHALRAAPTACVGRRRALALMPDWNTAELLGAHPRPLALDLFARLIGGRAWRRARAALGYRRLRGVDLIAPFAGRPYVDVRASANSLLPAAFDADSATRLVDAWQARLLAQPVLHDRYEFSIAQTCLDFDFDAQWRARYAGVLDATQVGRYRAALRDVTERCLDARALQRATARLARLARRSAKASPDGDFLPFVHAIEHDGALSFALIARQAFAAEALLRSAVARGALTPARLLALQQSCVSATREFLAGDADWRERYGFLRAGTFEIATPPLAHLDVVPTATAAPVVAFEPTAAERRALQQLIDEAHLRLDADALLHHYRSTRQGREHAKYALSHAVSLLLEHVAAAGARRGLDRDTLGWLTLTQLGRLDMPRLLQQRADAARAQHRIDALLRLPPVLDLDGSLDHVAIDAGTPTFVGAQRVVARLQRVDARTRPADVPTGAALAIESADPGFDWIFTRAPAALITAYGGPNSHMAIRCAELRIPAVLGLGAERWRRLLAADHVVVDAASQSLTPWKDDSC